ncbi:MAG: AAA family ATPase [Planctomycetes bacterium]|nr:AAA family ATPase [Planctomycetota bacterium]
MTDPRELERELAGLRDALSALETTVGSTFLGQKELVEELLCGLLGGGHVLLEGVPGVGKTTLVKALASALELSFSRIQFTPDLMPADVLGTRILEEDEHGRRTFRFHRGPVFANVVLADEINRATPRTQSALLEAMAEGQVTVFGERLELEQPFFLVATQNPIEMEGTYPLPEAQIDRFTMQCLVRLPDLDGLVQVLKHTSERAAPRTKPVLDRARVLRLVELARAVPASSDVLDTIAKLVLTTHPTRPGAPDEIRRCVRHGASPRAGQALLWSAKARALLRGRLHVSLEDVERLAAPCLRHRLVLGFEGQAAGVERDELVRAAWAKARA